LKLPPSNKTVVLGIDPGLATTGWGVVEKGPSLVVRAYGAILTPASTPLPDRLTQLRRDLIQIIHNFQPALMAIEELYFAKFAVSIASTAQARGVILVTAAEMGLPIVTYNPRAVKIALTGFGSASKIQMQSMLQRHFRLQELPKPDDAADALAIALCHLQTNHHLKIPVSRKSRADFEAELAARAGVSLLPVGGNTTRHSRRSLAGNPSCRTTMMDPPPMAAEDDDKRMGNL
jgi:crossover junction endodeoxyribonuclease RuvC